MPPLETLFLGGPVSIGEFELTACHQLIVLVLHCVSVGSLITRTRVQIHLSLTQYPMDLVPCSMAEVILLDPTFDAQCV